MVSVRWAGPAGLEFTSEGKSWLIAPYLSRVGKMALFLAPPPEPEGHFPIPGRSSRTPSGSYRRSHAPGSRLDISEIIRRFPVLLVGSESLETLMTLDGMPGRATICREQTRIEPPGGAVVTMIPSLHGLILFGKTPYPGEIERGNTFP